jgi:uncharacterized protein
MRRHAPVFGRLLIACAILISPACAQREASTTGSGVAPRVLIVGGHADHDFDRWFRQADSSTIAAAGASVRYTDVPGEILPQLPTLDVLYLSNNQPLDDPRLREGIFAHLAAGKGLIIGHAASWHSWPDWPEYHRDLVSGGSRAHARLGEFQVDVIAPDHPIMQDVPGSFTVRDELYRFIPDPEGAPRTVLATAREEATGTVYPIIWTVKHPNGRIVVNTLGHDGSAHEHPAYQRILQNSVRWVSRQDR